MQILSLLRKISILVHFKKTGQGGSVIALHVGGRGDGEGELKVFCKPL